MRCPSDLNQLPDGLRQAMQRMEALTDGRWVNGGWRNKFKVAAWTLQNLAGEEYQIEGHWNPHWVPRRRDEGLEFWREHYKFWVKMLPGKERTKALRLCVEGLEEERKHV